MRIWVLSYLLLVAGFASASTTVLDFEAYETVNATQCYPTEPEALCVGGQILHKGYVVDMGSVAWWQGSDITECNNSFLLQQGIPCDVLYLGGWRLTQETEESFNILAVDLIVDWTDNDYSFDTTLSWVTSDDESLYYYWDATRASLGLSADFTGVSSTTVYIDADDIVYLEVYNPTGGVSVDNIVVSNVVPIPAAVWMFISGLGILAWIRIRARKLKQTISDWHLPPPDCLD